MHSYDAATLKDSWVRTCQALESVTETIGWYGSSVIPVLQLHDILSASEQRKRELKAVGCFVVRGVVPKTDATAWYHDLKNFLADNDIETGV
jgi:hypothetical protein